MISLRPEEWKTLASYIASICGIQLDESKQYLIEGRLSALVQETGTRGYTELCDAARRDATREIERRIIDAITTGETSFFRDRAPFDLLRTGILPDLIRARRSLAGAGRVPIRVWSAACSTGQEVYSIAMILREVLGDPAQYDLRLLGTDISREAVNRATAGSYSRIEIGRGLDPALLRRCMQEDGERWRVCDELRRMATFRTINLLQDFSYLGQFDVIFCRNVAIYFSDADRSRLYGCMARVLAPDGHLIIGSTETLMHPRFEAKRRLNSVSYQLAPGAVQPISALQPQSRPCGGVSAPSASDRFPSSRIPDASSGPPAA